MMPDGLKGIQRSSDDLSAVLFGASRYFNAFDGAPNANALNMMNQARRKTDAVLEEVNAFMNGDFAKYREKAEAVKVVFFKE
jgi:hypothetical protein